MVGFRYFSHLTNLESRFDRSKPLVSFTWYDGLKEFRAWEKSVKMSKRKLNSHLCSSWVAGGESIAIERSAILFNIGAVLANIGISEMIGGSVELAARNFQHAAWAFTELRDNVVTQVSEKLSIDLTRECLDMLVHLMLGHAQKCVVLKV